MRKPLVLVVPSLIHFILLLGFIVPSIFNFQVMAQETGSSTNSSSTDAVSSSSVTTTTSSSSATTHSTHSTTSSVPTSVSTTPTSTTTSTTTSSQTSQTSSTKTSTSATSSSEATTSHSTTSTSSSSSSTTSVTSTSSTSSIPTTLILTPSSTTAIADSRTSLIISPGPTPQNAGSTSLSSPESTESSSGSSSSSGFLHNTTAVVSTFTVLGLIFVAAGVFIISYFVRRRRQRREYDDEFAGQISSFGNRDRGKRATYATSSFGMNMTEKRYEPEQANETFSDEGIEAHLGQTPVQPMNFDPYRNQYNLPNDMSLVPEEYRLSVLDAYVESPTAEEKSYNPPAAAATIPHHSYSSPQAYGSTAQAGRAPVQIYPNGRGVTIPAHYTQEDPFAGNAYRADGPSMPLNRQMSKRSVHSEYGLAC